LGCRVDLDHQRSSLCHGIVNSSRPRGKRCTNKRFLVFEGSMLLILHTNYFSETCERKCTVVRTKWVVWDLV
jgi:hypothetical protein